MKRKETKEAILVMQAWLDGAEIQYRDRLYQEREFKGVAGTPLWSWSNNEYRIKPSPREFWVYPSLQDVWLDLVAPDADDIAEYGLIKVVEVCDD